MAGSYPDPMLPVLCRVARLRRETRDTRTLYLERADKLEGLSGAPGQFNMLYAFGVGEVPISISAVSGSDGSIAHTVRDVGAVTRAITRLKKGDSLGLPGATGAIW